MSYLARQDIMLVGIAVVVIIIAIVVSSMVQGTPATFSQVLTYGPVWNETAWICTSDQDFVVHGTLRGLGNALLTIRISELGAQGLYAFAPGQMKSFTVGAEGGQSITFVREGTVSGWLTLQTMSGARATCNNA